MSVLKKLTIFILIIMYLFTPFINLSATESPNSINVSSEYHFYEGYTLLKNMPSFSSKLSDKGDYLYCLTYHVEAPNGQTVTRGAELIPQGYVYLAQNGFPAKNITGDKDKDYYITQIAYWWFVDYLNGLDDNTDGNLPAKLKSNFNTNNGDADIINGINKLVSGAKEANNIINHFKISKFDTRIQLNEEKGYYISSPIYVSYSANIKSYTASFLTNDASASIVDSQGSNKTTFSAEDPFYVKVPIDKMNDNANITVKISTTLTNYHAYQYDASKPDKYQSLTYSILGSDTTTLTDTATLMGVNQTANLIIIKRDIASGEPLSGAHLALYNNKELSGDAIDTWISSNEPHEINNLVPGTYYLKETKAPDGYYTKKKVTTINLGIGDSKTVYENNNITTTIISKLDIASGEEISGAHLQVLDMNNKVIEEWDSNGKEHIIEGLKIGKYKLKETKAPDGYEKADEVVDFEVLDNGKTTEVIMNNIEKIEVPNTGSKASIFFYLASSLALIAGIVLAYLYVKQKET